jgi:hypothetical protein
MSLPLELLGRSYDCLNCGFGLAARECEPAALELGRVFAYAGWGDAGCGAAEWPGEAPRDEEYEPLPVGLPYGDLTGLAAVWARGRAPAVDAAYGFGDWARD